MCKKPGITGEDQHLHSHCKAVGKEGTGCEEHWVGGPVGCGKLVEEASVRVSGEKKHLRGKKLSFHLLRTCLLLDRLQRLLICI